MMLQKDEKRPRTLYLPAEIDFRLRSYAGKIGSRTNPLIVRAIEEFLDREDSSIKKKRSA